MNENEHERWSDDLAAYMLGALEPGEAAELERHLAGCERCRERMRWLQPAVRKLPDEVERLEPPSRLRDRVMAEVRADAEGRVGGLSRQERQRDNSAAGYRHRGAATGAPGWLRRLGSGSLGWRPLVGLAAILLALVAVAGYEVGGGGGGGGGGGEQTITSGRAPGVTATMVRGGEGGTLRLANVDQLPEDRVLEAWVQRDGEVEAVPALFVPDREGRASTTIEDMNGVELVMVTEEPKGGSEQPTSKPLVRVTIE